MARISPANAVNLATNPAAVPWIALKSPAPPADHEFFGASVLIRDLDGDGKGELIVGAIQRNVGAGMVYIYSGTKLAALTKHTAHDGVQAPPDQIIEAPTALSRPGDWFGWTLFDVDNMLGESWPAGRSDIGIHAEGTHWTDPNDPAHSVPDAGALFVYAAWDPGETPTSAAPFLKPNPVVLYTPVITVSGVVVHQPSNDGRMGRGAAPVVWRRQTLTGSEEVRGLLVGEPDAPVRDPGDPSFPHTPEIERAGRVFFFKAPLDGPNGTKNAWGDFVLLEPIDSLPEGAGVPGPTAFPMQNVHLRPAAFARFGAWIVSGRYTTFVPGSQFVVSARNRDLPVANDAGRAYSFHLPDLGP